MDLDNRHVASPGGRHFFENAAKVRIRMRFDPGDVFIYRVQPDHDHRPLAVACTAAHLELDDLALVGSGEPDVGGLLLTDPRGGAAEGLAERRQAALQEEIGELASFDAPPVTIQQPLGRAVALLDPASGIEEEGCPRCTLKDVGEQRLGAARCLLELGHRPLRLGPLDGVHDDPREREEER